MSGIAPVGLDAAFVAVAVVALIGCSWTSGGASNGSGPVPVVVVYSDAGNIASNPGNCGPPADAYAASDDASNIDESGASDGAAGVLDAQAPPPTCPAHQQLQGHISPKIANAPLVGPVPGTTIIQLSIGMPLRNEQELQREVKEISDPYSPCYRHYLTQEQLVAAFSPTESDYQSLINWAVSKGLSVVSTYSNRILLTVRGTVAAVNQALCITLSYYLRPDGSEFYGPDREPSLDLTATVEYIGGLNNYFVPIPVGPSVY